MESGLEALARGLRGAGGILNPEVQKMDEQERRQQDAIAENRKTVLAQLAIKGAEAGSIDPTKATEMLSGLGFNVPAGSIGPTPEAMQRRQTYENDVGFRKAVSDLGPGASPLLIANAASKYGKPELAVQMYQREEDRLDKASARRDALEERARQFDLMLSNKNLDREMRERLMAQADETKRLIAASTSETARMRLALDEAKAGNIKDEKLRKETVGLSNALNKANLPEADATLGAVEKMLKDKPELASWITGPKSAIPDLAAPQEVRDARQAFNKLFNVTLKLRSGAAVTQQELDRLKSEFGVGIAKNPEQVATAVQQSRDIIQKHYRAVSAGYGPDVLRAYNDNISKLGGKSVLGDSPKVVDFSAL
jgi:hypothetical protein